MWSIFFDEKLSSLHCKSQKILYLRASTVPKSPGMGIVQQSRNPREMYRLSLGKSDMTSLSLSWLPDGYSQILRSYVFGPSGLKDYGSATLRCKIWSLPFLGLRPHPLHPGAIQGKEGIKFCHLATLCWRRCSSRRSRSRGCCTSTWRCHCSTAPRWRPRLRTNPFVNLKCDNKYISFEGLWLLNVILFICGLSK